MSLVPVLPGEIDEGLLSRPVTVEVKLVPRLGKLYGFMEFSTADIINEVASRLHGVIEIDGVSLRLDEITVDGTRAQFG